MPSTNMNNFNRRGSMENKFVTSNKQQLPARNNSRDPMRSSISKIANNSSNESLIDGALAVMNSPQPNSKPRVMRRRGSLLTARKANELLLDSSDLLSEMMRKGKSTAFDNNCDYDDSDLEEL